MAFDDTSVDPFGGYPGLASAPDTTMMPSLGGSGDAGVAEQTGFKAGPSGMLSAASPDLGFAASAPPMQTAQQRLQSDKDYLANLPTGMKIGLALQAFASGVAGTESPIDKLLKRKHEQDAAARKDIDGITGVLNEAYEKIKKVRQDNPGSLQEQALRNAYKIRVPAQFHGAIDAIGTDQQANAESLNALASNPHVRDQLVKVCGNDRACWKTQMANDKLVARWYDEADAPLLPALFMKLRAIKAQFIDKGALAEKNKEGFSHQDIIEGNAKLKILESAEMDILRRHPEYLNRYGIKTTADYAVTAKEQAKQEAKPEKENWKEGDTRRILDPSGTELQQEFKGGKWTTIGKKGDKTKELTPGQKLKLERETRAYDEAVKKLKEYGIEADGSSARPEVQKRLLPTAKSGYVVPDPQFAGRVREWMKRRDAGDPRQEIPGEEAPKPGTATPIRNKDGSLTTERSITIQDDRINNGKPTNIPTVWNGKVVPDDQAIANAAKSGAKFQSFNSIEEAVAAAKKRSADLGAGRATSVGGASGAAVATRLSSVDRQKVIDAATAAVNKGADPEAVKKRLKDKYGIEVTFTSKKK